MLFIYNIFLLYIKLLMIADQMEHMSQFALLFMSLIETLRMCFGTSRTALTSLTWNKHKQQKTLLNISKIDLFNEILDLLQTAELRFFFPNHSILRLISFGILSENMIQLPLIAPVKIKKLKYQCDAHFLVIKQINQMA